MLYRRWPRPSPGPAGGGGCLPPGAGYRQRELASVLDLDETSVTTTEETRVTTTTTISSPDGQTALVTHELVIRGRVYLRGNTAVAYVDGNRFRLQAGVIYWQDRRIGAMTAGS